MNGIPVLFKYLVAGRSQIFKGIEECTVKIENYY
jgi:hypothetical protein